MDTVFFIASKLIGAILRPDTWIVITLACIVLALILNRRRIALWISSITLGLLVVLSTLPLGGLLLQPIERRYPANPSLDTVDGLSLIHISEPTRPY